MKRIKTFESFQVNENEEDLYTKINDIKIGDYVIVTCPDYELQDEIMIVDYIEVEDIRAHKVSETIEDGYTIFDTEIVRKLEDYEISAIKYNM